MVALYLTEPEMQATAAEAASATAQGGGGGALTNSLIASDCTKFYDFVCVLETSYENLCISWDRCFSEEAGP